MGHPAKKKQQEKFQRLHPEGRRAFSKSKKAKPRKFNDQEKRIANKIERRKLKKKGKQ